MRRIILAAVGMLIGSAVSLTAQVVTETQVEHGPRFLYASPSGRPFQPLDAASVPSLRRKITLQLDGVDRRAALVEIMRAARLDLAYSDSIIPANGRIRLIAQEITVAAALTEVLLDAGVDIVLSPNGRAALVKRTSVKARAVGVLAGRVTERRTNAPVVSARVTVTGVISSRYTDDKGQYWIPDVPAGEHEVTVRRVGFEAVSRKVNIGNGETVTADFLMERVATTLTEVVTTAAGERSRLEVGNSIGTIKADSLVPTTLIRNMSDLLQARMPGVLVSNGEGQVGAASRIRIRGVNSLTLNNDPIIVLDGVRLNWLSTSAVGVNGTSTSQTVTGLAMVLSKKNNGQLTNRLDDLDPNTIESIDVLRGPSAATLYGTEAANGVIVIKTKKGGTGSWHLNLLTDDGWSTYGHYPATVWAWGVLANGRETNLCNGPLAAGFSNNQPCQLDSVSRPFNGNNDQNLTTLGTGSTRNVSMNLSGGSQQMQEFLSLRGSDQIGVEKLSDVEQRRVQRMWGVAAPSWMVRPNGEQDLDGSSRSTIRVNSALDLQLSAQGIYRNVRGAQTLVSIGNNYLGSWDTLANLQAELATTHGTGVIKRGFVSTNANYIPLSWLTVTATLGGDYTLRSDNILQSPSTCTVILAPSTGCTSSHTNDRGETFVTTANIGAQLSFTPRSWLGLRTALGEQYSGTTFYELNAGNTGSTNLAFGTDLLTPSPVATSGTPQLFNVAESRDQSASAGYYVEQTVALRERFFVTAAFRQDAASAFGAITNQHLPTYPKFSLSWLVSDETFFPFKDVIPSFRLRAAYGHSGNQARQTDRLPNYIITTVFAENNTTPVQGVVLGAIPNPILKPERSIEAEGGFDLSLLANERVHIEATLYRKISKDAIINAPVPNSYGALISNQSENIGSVENRGVELALTAKLVDSRAFSWDMTANFTENHNKLVSINAMTRQIDPVNPTSYMWGYPLFGIWSGIVASYADLNGDGILEGNEVALSAGTPSVPAAAAGGFVFLGAPYPRGEFTYGSSFTLFSGVVRVDALFDHVKDVLAVEQNNGSLCRYAPATCTLAQQSEAVTQVAMGCCSNLERVSYLRFSELSTTVALPQAITRRVLHVRSAAVTFAGRNLALWSNYMWKDPAQSTNIGQESSGAGGGTSGLGQPRNWALRINLAF